MRFASNLALLVALLSVVTFSSCKQEEFADVGTEILTTGSTQNTASLLGAAFLSTGSASDTPRYITALASPHSDFTFGPPTARGHYGFFSQGQTELFMAVTNISAITYCGITLDDVRMVDNIDGVRKSAAHVQIIGETGQIKTQKLNNNCLLPGQTGYAHASWGGYSTVDYVAVTSISAVASGEIRDHLASPAQVVATSYNIPYATALDVTVTYNGGTLTGLTGEFMVMDNATGRLIDSGTLEMISGATLPTTPGETFVMIGIYDTPHVGDRVIISLLPNHASNTVPSSGSDAAQDADPATAAILLLLLGWLFI